jgi:hypothetical protein
MRCPAARLGVQFREVSVHMLPATGEEFRQKETEDE